MGVGRRERCYSNLRVYIKENSLVVGAFPTVVESTNPFPSFFSLSHATALIQHLLLGATVDT